MCEAILAFPIRLEGVVFTYTQREDVLLTFLPIRAELYFAHT